LARARTRRGRSGFRLGLRRGHQVGLREHAVNVIHGFQEARILMVARPRHGDAEIGADVPGILPQHHHAVGQRHRFFDVVSDDEDRARGHFLAVPKFQQFRAQVLRGEHVERGERLVHEEHFRLHHQRAGEADALLHAAGKFLGISLLEAVQAHRIENAQGALHALHRPDAARLERRFHIVEHRQPREQREALKTMETFARAGHRLAVPQHLSRRGRRKAGEHAQHGGFARAGWP
jgi:hypothetical protein